jgi:FkbM family methyltransferase
MAESTGAAGPGVGWGRGRASASCSIAAHDPGVVRQPSAKGGVMLVQAQRFDKENIRSLFISLGLFPYAKRGVEWIRAVPYLHKTRFVLQMSGREVSFVTRDAHSKVWCHRRHENRQQDLHEPAIIKAFARFVERASIFADVGGHIGYYSCVAGVLNPRLKIFCFEMNRRLVPLIRTNFEANALRDAIVVPSPVADKHRLVSYDGMSKSGGQSIHAESQLSQKRAKRVYTETITLDDYFGERGVAPDIIKIDVEGAEMDVLRGASSLLKQARPLLFLELHPTKLAGFSSSVPEIVEYLERTGYSFYKTSYFRLDGTLEPIDSIELSSLARSDMVICVPQGQAKAWDAAAEDRPGQELQKDEQCIVC